MAKSKNCSSYKKGGKSHKRVRFFFNSKKSKTNRRRRSISKTRRVARSLRKGRGRRRTRTRNGGRHFRGGYGPGGGPVGAPWDPTKNVLDNLEQGLPSPNHYSYKSTGIGIGGEDPALSSRIQNGGGFMDSMMKFVPQELVNLGNIVGDDISNKMTIISGNGTGQADLKSSLPTDQPKLSLNSTVLYPSDPTKVDEFAKQAALEVVR
jgi:hypothetical protein